MGVYFTGDLDYKCTNYSDPTEFGCSSSTWEHFSAYSEDIEEINKGIQKYKDLLKPYGVNASDVNMDVVMYLEIGDIQNRWNLNQKDAIKVSQLLYSYCFGCEILNCVQSKGFCEFFIPG